MKQLIVVALLLAAGFGMADRSVTHEAEGDNIVWGT